MTDERLAETTWRCAPGCRADNDAGLHKPECERPAETTEAERLIRQFIPQKSYGGGELVADPEYFEAEKAWEALDAILARLDALDKLWQEVTKERDMLQMTQEEGREIMVEWAQQALRFDPVLACKCPSCTITRGLDAAETKLKAAEADAEALAQALEVIFSWRDPEAMREHARTTLEARGKVVRHTTKGENDDDNNERGEGTGGATGPLATSGPTGERSG